MAFKLLRFLLFPITLLYGLVVFVRNLCFDWGIFKATSFPIPVIVIGNITVGGAGKSPMTEYLVRLLKADSKVAVLSRGYGRKTRGFRWVETQSDALEVGDEPLQFKNHFPDVTVAVCENRVTGLNQLVQQHEVVLLDDAFQHRWLKPSCSILLLEYSSLQKIDFLLPTGNLREPKSAYARADVLVVSKSPKNMSEKEQLEVRKLIQPKAHQALFFSYLAYGLLTEIQGQGTRALTTLSSQTAVFLLTGIANAKPILTELDELGCGIQHYEYPDHYAFNYADLEKLIADFKQCAAADKLIITTEKDAQRLKKPTFEALLAELPMYVLPVESAFIGADQQKFKQLIQTHVREY